MSTQATAAPAPLVGSRLAAVLLGAATIASVVLIIAGVAGPEWWKIIILGIVEGLTEFLPISSTAHLLLTSRLIGFENSLGGTFEIFIQLGAVLAVVGYYAQDLIAKVRDLPTSRETQRFWLNVLIAFIPAAVFGLSLRNFIKGELFQSPTVIAGALIIGGIVLIAIERVRLTITTTVVEQMSHRQALLIGLAQATALIPGVSRSGASMVGGLLGGLDRTTATRFAFYLSIPTLGIATIVDLLQSLRDGLLSSSDIGPLALGTLVSFVVAWLSIGWLLRYVSRNSFAAFGVYRIIAGIVVLVAFAVG